MILKKLSWLLQLLIVVIFFTGCTTVNTTKNGKITQNTYFGFTKLAIENSPDSLSIEESKNLGAVYKDNSFTVGWISETKVIVSNDNKCVAIIWMNSSKEAENFLKYLEKSGFSLDKICVINKGALK